MRKAMRYENLVEGGDPEREAQLRARARPWSAADVSVRRDEGEAQEGRSREGAIIANGGSPRGGQSPREERAWPEFNGTGERDGFLPGMRPRKRACRGRHGFGHGFLGMETLGGQRSAERRDGSAGGKTFEGQKPRSAVPVK
jgi:hypothetical protein